MLINFNLVPVQKVQPWGSPGQFRLSWFGLTEGQYWIQAGESVLFEYSEQAQTTGVSRYCDYQVVRLYEDLVEMLPHILEPIPDALVQFISGDTAISWRKTYGAWRDRNYDHLDRDRFNQIIDAADIWAGARWLDSGYLSPSANIAIWSDITNIHFEWDNRGKIFDGKPAWSALRGNYQLPRQQFLAEMQSFHARLMAAMSERIEQVLSGALSSEIAIDLPGLVREHDQRCRTLDMALNYSPRTDWQETERSIHEILRT